MSQMPEHEIFKTDDAGQDLRSALNRLRAEAPSHPDLKRAKKQGRLRINISTVAKEAGRSRTLIGTAGCAYPEIRADVLAASKVDAATPRRTESRPDAQKTIATLREENRLLRHEKAILATRIVDALNVARALERKAADAVRRAERIEGRKASSDKVVGRTLAKGNVVPFVGGDE